MTQRRRLEELTEGVLLATSTLYSTTSTVIYQPAGDGSCLVIDPCWTPAELQQLTEDIKDAGLRPVIGFATHAHHDHVLWHPGLGQPPRFASAITVSTTKLRIEEILGSLDEDFGEELRSLVGQLTPLEADTLPWNGPDAQVITHHGHCPGHSALWIESLGLLVAGDMLSDLELPLLEDGGGLQTYRRGLELMRQAVEKADWLIPGHGTPTSDPLTRLRSDLDYLEALAADRQSEDERLSHPGMDEAHRSNVEAVERQHEGA